MGTGRFRETQHSDGRALWGSDAGISADIAQHGGLRGIQHHGAKQAVPGIRLALNTTGDVCLSVVTGPFRDIIEIGTGKDMWDDRELTRTEIGVRVGLTFGVPIAGIFLAKAFSVGSKVARAVHRAEQAGETVEEVLESGVRIADRAENVAGTAKDAIQPGIRTPSDVGPRGAVDFAESTGRLGGKLWGSDRISTLKRYLENRGVEVLTNRDELLAKLAKQRGLNGADAAFVVGKDGKLRFLLSKDPTRREVLHELGHFLHRQKVGASTYDKLTTAQKESWVSNFLRDSNNWRQFTPEEQWRELENLLKYAEGLE